VTSAFTHRAHQGTSIYFAPYLGSRERVEGISQPLALGSFLGPRLRVYLNTKTLARSMARRSIPLRTTSWSQALTLAGSKSSSVSTAVLCHSFRTFILLESCDPWVIGDGCNPAALRIPKSGRLDSYLNRADSPNGDCSTSP